ncbi:hypothetical protein CEB3_c18230 [Peptococcaceae bacterium CEB3]|nr:hypothetical protein CEB3_c18230 [Peptococcaceae bacterium CEB3]
MSRLNRNILYLIQIMLGWEFFVSGWNKLVSVGHKRGFPLQLADALKGQVKGLNGWYINFLKSSVIPHAVSFGYLVEWGETLAGIGLIVCALIFMFKKIEDDRVAKALNILSIIAMVGIAFMSLNFWLMAGAPSFLPGGQDPNGEGFTIDAFLTILPFLFIWWEAVALSGASAKTPSNSQYKPAHYTAQTGSRVH